MNDCAAAEAAAARLGERLRAVRRGESPALVMGDLNVTPDSFSDGGQFHTPDAA
ncbi:MAG: dihydropteroate synthase, partial [Pseudomonadota bacterium]